MKYRVRFWERLLGKWDVYGYSFINPELAESYARQERGGRWVQVIDEKENVIFDSNSAGLS